MPVPGGGGGKWIELTVMKLNETLDYRLLHFGSAAMLEVVPAEVRGSSTMVRV